MEARTETKKLETGFIPKKISLHFSFFALNVLFHDTPRLAKLSKARKESDLTEVVAFEAAAATAAEAPAVDEDHTKGEKVARSKDGGFSLTELGRQPCYETLAQPCQTIFKFKLWRRVSHFEREREMRKEGEEKKGAFSSLSTSSRRERKRKMKKK